MPSQKKIEEALKQIQVHQTVLGKEVTQTLATALQCCQEHQTSAPRPQAQRKQITVLYADISGLTALTETMDAEDVINIMNQLWDKLDKEVIKHGGRIEKHFGDAVMAIWGVDQSREDDAERGVRAALAMKDAIHQFINTHPNAPLNIRLGIHSGPAILGHVGTTAEFTAIGDTVNTAGHLAFAAANNQILVSHDTHQLIRGIFVFDEKKRLSTKGKEEPLRTYVVSEALEHAFRLSTRGIEGLQTQTIGRDKDFTLAQSACFQAINRRFPALISLTGEAGVGKSRLLDELEQWLEEQPRAIHYFKGRATQQMQYQPYALLRNVFLTHWQLPYQHYTSHVALQQITDKIKASRADLSNEQIHSICQLLGLIPVTAKDKKKGQSEAQAALVQYIHHLTKTGVTTWLIEDIHWADSSTLDLLSALHQEKSDRPLLLITTTRPDFWQINRDWGSWTPHHTQLKVLPLSSEHAHKLAKEILQKVDEVPEQLEILLVEHSHGNPLYMEELIQMLIADGTIITSPNQWLINPTKLSKVRLPPTLTGILQARLESLPLAERTLLQQASILGRSFCPEAVLYLREQIGAPQVNLKPLWKSLCQKELIQPEEDALLNKKVYVFCNPILREVAHESVLIGDRRIYHAHVAQWLIDQHQEETEIFSLIAEHLEQVQNNSQAIVYLRHAGEQAQQTFGFQETIHFFKRALALLAQTENYEERIQLTREIARAMINFGQWDTAKTWLQESLDLARQSATPQQIMSCLQDLTQLAKQRGEYQDAMACIEEGLEIIKHHKELLGADSAAYFQKATEGLTGLLSSATDKAGEVAREQAEQAKKKLGKAFSGVMGQFKKTHSGSGNDNSQ